MTDYPPRISVIVPVYRAEKYLEACAESVLHQTFANYELILVDDGSPDGSGALCDRLGLLPGVKVIHQENRGVSAARNRGIEAATGEYLMFLDSDDLLLPNAMELLLNDAEATAADVVSGVKRTLNEAGERACACEDGALRVYEGLEPLKLSLNYDRQTSVVQAKLFRREFVKELRFAEGRQANEDGFYLFQCYALQPKLVQHNVPVYLYRVLPDSSSRTGGMEKYYDILYFGEEKARLTREQYPELRTETVNMLVSTHIFFLYALCRTRDRKYLPDREKSLRFVRENSKTYQNENRFEQKMLRIVRCRIYWLYQWAVWRKRSRKRRPAGIGEAGTGDGE